MKIKKFFALLSMFGFVGWCMWSCEPLQKYSDIPVIKFMSLSFEDVTTELGTDKMAILTFSFVDGDGDIGVRSKDSISKIHYTWYKKLPDETYEPYQFPKTGTINDSTAIPYGSVMNKDEAHNKTLNGSIKIALSAPTHPKDVDIMHIKYHIFDRARNKSNVDQTPDFSILNPPDELLPNK